MSTRLRILLLTQWFDPEPTFKGMVFARELVRQGFVVEVLTGFPNYPCGKIYRGYKVRWLKKEVIDGVKVTRVPLYPSHDSSPMRRVLNYVSFAISSLFYGLFIAQRPDLIYAYHPPLTVGVTATVLRFMRRVPVVYDIQDLWPDTLRATGMLTNRYALAAVGKVCDWVYRHVNHIVVLSPGLKRILMQRTVPKKKIEVIYNWADENALQAHDAQLSPDFPGPEKFKILFAGNLGRAQAIDTVLQAACLMQQRGSRVCWVLIGDGVERSRLQASASRQGLSNVVFLPGVPMCEVGVFLRSADALLVHLRNDPLFEITIPSKTQAYMAVGKPLLMAVDGDARDLVLYSGAGLTAPSEDPILLANAAEALAEMPRAKRHEMARAAQAFYHEHLSLRVGSAKFGEVFRKVVDNETIT